MLPVGLSHTLRNTRFFPANLLFCGIQDDSLFWPAPILWQHTCFNIAMEGRIWPIAHLFNKTMFYWIEMEIIHVVGKILVIPYLMFPKPALPQTCFAAFDFAVIEQLVGE